MQPASPYHQNPSEISKEVAQINAAKQNPRLFDPLYRKYHEAIFRFVYQRVSDKTEAADITSQVFIKAISNLHKYEIKGFPFSSWLFRIAINQCNTMFRQQKAERSINLETDQAYQLLDEIDELQKEKELEVLLKSLPELKEEDLVLVEMRFFEKRAFKEIGEILGITENNAKVKLYRALDKLKLIAQDKIHSYAKA